MNIEPEIQNEIEVQGKWLPKAHPMRQKCTDRCLLHRYQNYDRKKCIT